MHHFSIQVQRKVKKFYCTSSTYNSASMITASKARINGSFLKNIFFNIFDFLFEIRSLFQKNFPKLFHFLGRFLHTVCTRKLSKRLSCSGPLIVPRKQYYYTQPYILLTLKARKRPSKAIHYSMLSSLDFPENGAFRSIMFH